MCGCGNTRGGHGAGSGAEPGIRRLKTPEVLAVVDRIVYPYEPSVIVYYCGDNDLGTDNTDSESAAAGFIQFAPCTSLPKTKILYMSIKPSIARWDNWEAMTRANVLVARYCGKHDHAYYMDLASPLLKNGKPDPDVFWTTVCT